MAWLGPARTGTALIGADWTGLVYWKGVAVSGNDLSGSEVMGQEWIGLLDWRGTDAK
jgi:hypothetical protein